MESKGKERVALIVNADDAVGEAVALRLARPGVQLALVGADAGRLDRLASRLVEKGVTVIAMVTNAVEPGEIRDTVARVMARYGRIDILVHNEAALAAKPLQEIADADVGAALDAGLAAPFHYLREVVPGMRKGGFGRVVCLSDLRYLGLANTANVAAARSGLFGLTRALALESARDGVTVSTVVIGDLDSDATPAAEREKLAGSIPVKRLGTPADVANAVGFLAADSSKYVTGQTLFVCGGKSAYFSMSI
ncbi:SDR family NAD(P)-dependent oxidoreductase [Aromatoleum aromaticum]|uniref:Subunit of 2-[hydroxy(Phenyl)methyl]-succinyl-CoA DH n=1 Tax=Aromatoleum aromaticum (strain DSM 19018 / LMG 30748 / EbN1) TaxID=76114 RepID=Q5P685_AROAE|nr:SDR family oxidoreductase [Aromatoleum aromaticum]NMG54874.1 SDR family oxidoreductase [Aromatoleum aromaticum]CAI07176.1 subunit of 2-[hydroxy(phenyl)methyl]-succinyl-CoA DH [Aromatoleum aromaticum EbN1]